MAWRLSRHVGVSVRGEDDSVWRGEEEEGGLKDRDGWTKSTDRS